MRALAALVAVADHGTFSAAAAALHTVQSNVSTHVRRLERELGVELVDRAAGRLTPEGEVVVARARRVQAELDALASDVGALRDEVSGSVRLGCISTTARWLVPLLVTAIGERHPKINLVVVDASTTSLAPQVLSGQLDIAVVNLPLRDADLAVEPLFEEELLVVVPRGHRFATRKAVGLRDLASEPLLLPPPGTAFRTEVDDAAAAAGVRLVARAEVDGVRLITTMAAEGHGAAILPVSAVTSVPDSILHRVHLRGLAPRHVGLTWRRRGLLSAASRTVCDVLREIVGGDEGRAAGVRQPGSAGATSSSTATPNTTMARSKTAPPNP
jgi:DNA-binding transcriptional LysR family regulator